jgi:hypothetical protein
LARHTGNAPTASLRQRVQKKEEAPRSITDRRSAPPRENATHERAVEGNLGGLPAQGVPGFALDASHRPQITMLKSFVRTARARLYQLVPYGTAAKNLKEINLKP